jgi:hypothetical protein
MATLTNLEELHQEAFDKSIEIDRHYFETTSKSRCFKDGDFELIVLNTSHVDSSAKEYTALAEELSHLETGTLYHLNDNFNTQANRMIRVKAEATAKNHMVKKRLPACKIASCLKNGITSLFEMADELCVTADFLEYAIRYHKSNGVVFETPEWVTP